ncbi:MAG: hypothetical protein ACI4GC_07655 [Acutalibacteraceae bacterium]
MKKVLTVLLSLIFSVAFFSCSKSENRADTSLKSGEIMISGTVESVIGSSLLITDKDAGKYVFDYSDEVEVVIDGYYVVDMTADSFKGKEVAVICSEEILETFPMQLTGERIIIIK